MINFKKLDVICEETGEVKNLYDGENFKNFDWLHEELGDDYDNVNDDLMDGIVDGVKKWSYEVYKNGDLVKTFTFTFEASEN